MPRVVHVEWTTLAVHITNPLLQHKLQPYQTIALANHMHQQVPLYTQVMFAVLHVLLNTSLTNTLSSHCVFIHVNTYPYIQSNPREYLPLQNSYIKSHLHLPLQNIYTYKSPIYIYPCKTSTHTVQKSHFPMLMRNWMLPHFSKNYRTKRDFDEKEYYAGLRQEWDFRVNESNALHDDLVQLEAPLVDRVPLTLSRRNMHQYERVVTKIKKENNLMILRRSGYHMLQLAEELAAITNRKLIPAERNNVLNYEDYLLE